MNKAVLVAGVALLVIGAGVAGYLVHDQIDPDPYIPDPDNGNGGNGNDTNGEDNETWHPIYQTYNLSVAPYVASTWNGLKLHSFELGRKYKLDQLNVTIDMSPGDTWAGANQILFYMSNSMIPASGNDEIWWIDNGRRMGAPSNDRPWILNVFLDDLKVPTQVPNPIGVRSGKYFIIGFTNRHEFTHAGTIVLDLL
jgi:hypothetical protein